MEKKIPTNESVFKWLVVGFLSCIVVLAVLFGVIIYMFTPLISLDENSGRIRLFGGAIDLEARRVITHISKKGSYVFGTIEGEEKLPAEVNQIEIKFGAGGIHVEFNESEDEFNWDCDGAGKSIKLKTDEDGAKAVLDFSATFVDCDISAPMKPVRIEGLSGQVHVSKISKPVEIKLLNGEVGLGLRPNQDYKFDLSVEAGTISESFISSENKDAILVKVSTQYGSIEALD